MRRWQQLSPLHAATATSNGNDGQRGPWGVSAAFAARHHPPPRETGHGRCPARCGTRGPTALAGLDQLSQQLPACHAAWESGVRSGQAATEGRPHAAHAAGEGWHPAAHAAGEGWHPAAHAAGEGWHTAAHAAGEGWHTAAHAAANRHARRHPAAHAAESRRCRTCNAATFVAVGCWTWQHSHVGDNAPILCNSNKNGYGYEYSVWEWTEAAMYACVVGVEAGWGC